MGCPFTIYSLFMDIQNSFLAIQKSIYGYPKIHFWISKNQLNIGYPLFDFLWSVRVAERLALSTSDHGVAGSNPAGGEILPEPKRRFIARSLSCSPSHRLEMTEILLKGHKTLTHPSIFDFWYPKIDLWISKYTPRFLDIHKSIFEYLRIM